jgi:hypothetical protein
MDARTQTPPRREFLADVGRAGAALALGACASTGGGPVGAAAVAAASAPPAPHAPWDLSWLDRVRRARHRALFDGPQGDIALMLAARWLDNLAAVYGAVPADAVAVVNLRTRPANLGLADAVWAKYPIGEDANVRDAAGAPVRRNPSYRPAPDASQPVADMTLGRLQQRGAVVLVCDFALGHLADRLAAKVGTPRETVHAELRAGLLPGAFLVPSGIFGMAEAQNAGCAFVPG